ncbi:MAG: hypothetical protein AAGF84_06285 [Planctomycetota bacterium]
MRKLDPSSFERAVLFIQEHGRSIDRAAFAVRFDDGDPAAVAEALKAYQNGDGGFGHAIEPDFRLPDSTATATTVAFQFLIAAGVDPTHEVVRSGVRYLLDTYSEPTRSWRPVVPAITEHPRAQWWEDYPPITYRPDASSWGNPNIEAIGALCVYETLVDEAFLNARIDDAVRWIEAVETMEAHELLCAIRFANWFRGDLPEAVEPKLVALASKTAEVDAAHWRQYGAQPVWFARRPETPMADVFRDVLPANLDFVVEQQQDDGSWRPTWEWGRYENDWPKAEREWAGHLTLQNLKLLSAFGRIEGVDVA